MKNREDNAEMYLITEFGEFMKRTNTLDPNSCATKCVVNPPNALNSFL